jgi:hypothetical protein
MENITTLTGLADSILLLEHKRVSERDLLELKVSEITSRLTPLNIIKESLSELSLAKDFKADLLDTSMGLAAGYLSKKIIIGSTENPIKKVLGAILQIGVTSFVAKNNEGLGIAVKHLLNNLLNRENK